MLLETKDLTKIYRRGEKECRAVDKASISVEKGELAVITGPSGCGKSTLFHLISGITVPDSGLVLFEGDEITGISPQAAARLRAEKISYILQGNSLLANLTVLENICLPHRLSGCGIDVEERAIRLLEDVYKRQCLNSIMNIAWIDREMLMISTLYTLRLLFLGYFIGVALGLVTGITCGYSARIRYWVDPIIKFLGPIPTSTWIPIIMVVTANLFGGSIFIIALGSWFDVYKRQGLGLTQLGSIMLPVAFVEGILAGYSLDDTMKNFVKGTQSMCGVMVFMVLASIMSIILNQAGVLYLSLIHIFSGSRPCDSGLLMLRI